MAQVDRSFIGAGNVNIQPYDKSAPLLPMGNISEFTTSFDEEKKELKNYQGGGGNANVLTNISGITGNIKAHDFLAANIAKALRAAVKLAATADVADEMHTVFAKEDELVPFANIPDLSSDVTVVDGAGNTTITAGEHYEITKSGIRFLMDVASLTSIKVTYKSLDAQVVQALVESGKDYTLFMEGLNDAQSGKPFTIRVHRIKFSPAQNLGFISEDFAELDMPFEILSDPRQTGNGISRFMQIDLAE